MIKNINGGNNQDTTAHPVNDGPGNDQDTAAHIDSEPLGENMIPIVPRDKTPKETPTDVIINDLERFFAGVELPTDPVQLNDCAVIQDARLFVESELATIKKHKYSKTFLPSLERMKEFRDILENHPG